jgi:hypothetical protein
METVIYMPLLGEGTDCWRPVRAVQAAGDVFEVVDQLRAGESWAFAPGSRVRCRNHVFTTGRQGLAAFEYAVESNPYYQLLKKHEGEIVRVVFSDGEEAVVRVLHVDGQFMTWCPQMSTATFAVRERVRPTYQNLQTWCLRS